MDNELIPNKATIDDIDSFSIFSTNSFNLVWEKVCVEVMDNHLHTKISDLKLSNTALILEGAHYSESNELINVIEKSKRYLYLI